MKFRGIDDFNHFLNPTDNDLEDQNNFDNILAAAERLKHTIEAKFKKVEVKEEIVVTPEPNLFYDRAVIKTEVLHLQIHVQLLQYHLSENAPGKEDFLTIHQDYMKMPYKHLLILN